MKKILLATSALVASASFASAEVSLSGYAEMGVRGGSANETQFHHDIDVKFSLSGETDSGLTFGATIDLDEVSAGISNNANPSSVFISGGFGKVTMGDTDGAMDWAMQDVGIGSAIADDHTSHGGYHGNNRADGQFDGQILRYDNTFGAFGVALSAEMDDTPASSAVTWGLGVKYSTSLGAVDLGLGLGFQDYDTDSAWGVSVDAKFSNGLRAIVNYSDLGDSDGGGIGETHTAIGLGYSAGALTVSANYGIYKEGAVEQDGYGLAVNYDLGGGAVVMAGFGDTSNCGVYGGCSTDSTWSLGLGLSF